MVLVAFLKRDGKSLLVWLQGLLLLSVLEHCVIISLKMSFPKRIQVLLQHIYCKIVLFLSSLRYVVSLGTFSKEFIFKYLNFFSLIPTPHMGNDIYVLKKKKKELDTLRDLLKRLNHFVFLCVFLTLAKLPNTLILLLPYSAIQSNIL